MVASPIPHMTYRQYRTARRLVHECCNYDCGNCLLLDNGEECICPQSITYSLVCRCPSVGRWLVRRPVSSTYWQTTAVPGVRKTVFPAKAQHALLFHLRRRPGQTE